ncbi:hypothetical protein O181_003663 [Austropuccinia psidii MF-1]|uniref:Integrase zinc-binding domain-containing protein n=1 Tax=Austropuccinia psidii MF-1 TaxID=1389203 RepID=A0A9Q3BF43_9BASI|nr:hypothetical protein [Austropuccinia psidii MF-1]
MIVHKSRNTYKNADVLSRWAAPNIPDNPAFVPENAEPQDPIEGVDITDLGTDFFEAIGEGYKQDKNFHILTFLLDKDCKDTALDHSLDYIWKKAYDNGRFRLFDGISYHKSKHTFSMVLCIRTLINTIFLKFHDNIYSGNLSQDRKMERIKKCSWWPLWRKDLIEYYHSFDKCQKDKESTGRIFG